MSKAHWNRIRNRSRPILSGAPAVRPMRLNHQATAKWWRVLAKYGAYLARAGYRFFKTAFYVVTTASLVYIGYLQWNTQDYLAKIEKEKNTPRVSLEKVASSNSNSFPSLHLTYNFDKTLINELTVTELATIASDKGYCWVRITNAYNFDYNTNIFSPRKELNLFARASRGLYIEHQVAELYINMDRDTHSVNRIHRYFIDDSDYGEERFELDWEEFIERKRDNKWVSLSLNKDGSIKNIDHSMPADNDSNCVEVIRALGR